MRVKKRLYMMHWLRGEKMKKSLIILSSLIFFLLLFKFVVLVEGTEPTTYALQFDGSDDYIEVASSSELKFANYTIFAWFYPTNKDGPQQDIISKLEEATATKGWQIWVKSGSVAWKSVDSTGLSLEYSQAVTNNAWHLIQVRYNSSHGNIWLNGTNRHSAAENNNGAYTHDDPLYVGCGITYGGIPPSSSKDYFFNGTIDEILLFNRYLSNAEMEHAWNGENGRYEPLSKDGLVAWYKVDEGKDTDLRDKSGYEHHGTFQNVTWTTGHNPDWYEISEFSIKPNYLGIISSVEQVTSAAFQLSFMVSGASASTSTTELYCGSKGLPDKISGATSWNYDSGTNIATVSITHASSQRIIVLWQSSASGYFVLSVHVKQDAQPLSSVTVTVKPLAGSKEDSQNKTTTLQGLAQFELTYGSYLVKAYHDKKVKTMRVWLTDNKDVGFDFATPPYEPKAEFLVCVPIIAVVLYFFWRRR